MRWASLAPETTLWIVKAAGMRSLVGRSHLCKEPASIQNLPVCTRPNAHREGWEAFLGPYAPDYGALSTLRPDGIAFLIDSMPPDLAEADLMNLFQKAVGYPAQLLPIRAADWDSYEKLVLSLKTQLRAGRSFERWFDDQRRRYERLLSLTQRLTHKPTVACLQPTIPLSAMGRWAELVATWGGGVNVLVGERLFWEKLLHLDPEVIILSLPGSTLNEAGEALSQWARLPQVQGLSAFRAKRLYAFKGTAGLFYPSPLLVSAAEGLYELLHTPTYRFNRHIGRLWAPLL
ncbi:MAG: hypothetical protein N3E49_06850 [Bacteroidia bacterium]|nr:hypothetical protein [Bacteroidia bacterium]